MLDLRTASPILSTVLLLLLMVNASIPICHAVSPVGYVSQLNHSVRVNSYGFIFVNDTISFHNNYTSQVSIPEFTLTFPGQYYNRFFPYSISDSSFQVSSHLEGNLTRVRLTPAKEVVVDPGSTYNLTISFSGVDLMLSRIAQLVYVNLALYPGVSLNSAKVYSTISVPVDTVFTLMEGYNMTETLDSRLYNRTYVGVLAGTYRFQNASLGLLKQSTMAVILVPKAERTIKVDDDGSVWVIDMIQIKNIGKQNITSLKLLMLNPSLLRVKVIKPIGPEEDVDLNMLGQIDLKGEVRYNQTYSLKIKYPAPSGFIKTVNGRYSGNISSVPPIDGVVEEYIVRTEFSNGFASVQQPTYKVFNKANKYVVEGLIIEYEPKLFWSASTTIPLGLFTLIVLLGMLSYFQKGEEEEKKYAAEFFDVVGDKLQVVDSTLELYEDRRLGRVTKQRFNILKQEYVNRIGQTNGALAKAAGDFIKYDPEKKVRLEKILRLNRDLDQALRSIVADYDQLQAGRIGREEFDRRRPESFKRLDGLRKEIEEELRMI
ncbi:MAG: hypothetical protein ACUVQ8_06275 [Nitrososphaeria archaeon]